MYSFLIIVYLFTLLVTSIVNQPCKGFTCHVCDLVRCYFDRDRTKSGRKRVLSRNIAFILCDAVCYLFIVFLISEHDTVNKRFLDVTKHGTSQDSVYGGQVIQYIHLIAY